jgi:hypothetical protein
LKRFCNRNVTKVIRELPKKFVFKTRNCEKNVLL